MLKSWDYVPYLKDTWNPIPELKSIYPYKSAKAAPGTDAGRPSDVSPADTERPPEEPPVGDTDGAKYRGDAEEV